MEEARLRARYRDRHRAGVRDDRRLDYGAIGTVTNLAARLCGSAKPGQILVSQRLLGAVEALAEAEPVGELPFKGFSKPMPTFNVVGLRALAPGTASGG